MADSPKKTDDGSNGRGGDTPAIPKLFGEFEPVHLSEDLLVLGASLPPAGSLLRVFEKDPETEQIVAASVVWVPGVIVGKQSRPKSGGIVVPGPGMIPPPSAN